MISPQRTTKGIALCVVSTHSGLTGCDGGRNTASMGYQVLRAEKLSTNGNVGASLAHAFRARETPNAAKERTPDNQHIGAKSLNQAMAKFKALLPEKPRSNAVRCIEYVITASPEAYQNMSSDNWTGYMNDSLNWLRERHGAKNVFYACLHQDETTPHLSVYVVPKDEQGHLNARSFLGGRAKLSEMQTNFHEQVAKKYGLERGLQGSKAKHMTIQDYYGKMADLEKAIEPPKRKLMERDEDYAERYKKQLRPLLKLALEASKIKERNIQLEQYFNDAKQDSLRFKGRLEGLTPDQMRHIEVVASQWRRENEEKKALERQQRQDRNRDRGGFSR